MDLNVRNWTGGKVQMNFTKIDLKLMQYNEEHIFLNLGGV
jgi:hypothetical protein